MTRKNNRRLLALGFWRFSALNGGTALLEVDFAGFLGAKVVDFEESHLCVPKMLCPPVPRVIERDHKAIIWFIYTATKI